MILLDTCTLLWMAADQTKLSSKALETIESNPNALFVSSITAFEIAVKHRQQKLKLPLSPDKWFAQVINFHGIKECPVSSDIAILSALLPPIHNDPCDRMIVATAKIYSMVILTCDRNISQYKSVKVVW